MGIIKAINSASKFLLAAALSSSLVFAQESGDLMFIGFEIEKLLNLGSAVLATILFILTIAAYRRHMTKRLKFVSLAFLLFAIRGLITSLEIFGIDWIYVDPISSLLNFAILLSFFYGVLRK